MDPLDQFFKKKMEERQFSFEEAYWQEAERLIEAREKRRRRGLLWWFFGLGLIVLILLSLGGLWYYTSSGPAIANLPEQSEGAQLLPSSESNLSAPAVPEGVKNEKGGSADSLMNIPSAKEPAASDKSPAAKREGEMLPPVNRPLENDTGMQKKFLDTTLAPQLPIRLDAAQAKLDSVEKSTPIALQAQLIESLDRLPLRFQELSEHTLELGEKVDWEPSAIHPQHVLQWQLVAALSAYPGKGKNENWVGGLAGLGLTYPLSEHLALEAGIRYRLRGGTFGFSQESTRVEYRFGKTEERFRLAPEQLHYLETQLMAQWLRKRHRLGLGLSWSYLLGVEGSLQQSLKPEFGITFGAPLTAKRGWLEETSYKKQLISLKGSYFYRLSGHWQLGLEGQYAPAGLLDENTPEPGGQPSLRESGPWLIDIGIKYRL